MGTVRRVALLLTLCVAVAAAPLTLAHPQHSSRAELGWNEDQTGLEVSLSLIPEDLETALSIRAGHPVVLEHFSDSTPESKRVEIAGILEGWLADHFRVSNEAGALAHPALAGIDVSYKEVWLYFTLEVSSTDSLALHNTLLLDINPTQANRVHCLWSPPDETLLFDQTRVQRPIWP